MEALILEKQPLALGAYSTKILRRDYQRALMRVRRSVDGAQAEVRGDSQGEVSLDSRVKIFSGTSSATTLGEFVANSAYTDVDSLGSSSAATVAVWYDQSDFNSHMTQTVVNNQPSIVSSSGNVYQSDNGPQVLFWPGASRQMDLRELVGDFTVHLGFRVLSEYSGIKLFDSTNDLINISRPNSSITLSQITSSSTSLNGHPKSNKTSIDFSQKSQGFVTVSGTFASTGALKIGENFGGLSDFYIYPNAKKGEERRSVEAIQSRENQSPLAYSNRQDIDPQAFLNKFEGVASAFSLRSLTNSLDTKLATVRREVDNKEALVYPDSSGYLSLDSPIKW